VRPSNSDPPEGPILEVTRDEDEDEESLGFFPSWGALYATVIVYTIALVVLLLILTRVLDHSPT